MKPEEILEQKKYLLRLCISNQLDLINPDSTLNVWNNSVIRRHYIDNDAEIFALKMDMWKLCERYDMELPNELHDKK